MAVLPALPELLSHIAYAVLYMAVLLILTVGVFARRQF
jgi:hypothetical protein